MSNVSDEVLRQHVLECLDVSLALAFGDLNPNDMPLREAVQITTDGTSAKSETQLVPDVGHVLIRNFNLLQALPEVEKLREYLLASPFGESVFVNPGNNRIEDKNAQAHWFTNYYVIPMLLEYTGSDQLLAFDSKRAESVYESFQEFLRSDTVTYSVVAPLLRCKGDVESIPLDKFTRVRRLPDDELSSLAQGPFSSQHEVFSLRFCIETTEPGPKNLTVPLSAADIRVRTALGALRLARTGAVGIASVIRERLAPYGSAVGKTTITSSGRDLMGPGYTIATDDAEEIRSLYSVLGRDRQPTLDLALRRFGNAYERIRHEDRLIDFWIALEALFLPDDRQELSYRASLRVAYLLEDDSERRRQVFDSLRKSYKLRSDVVHGAAVEDAEEMAGISVATEEFVRRSIKVALYDPDAVEPGRLDRRILDGS